ncbi:MAG TPA: hypothetical protein VF170_01885 [Planctomycetaceae bacterium]
MKAILIAVAAVAVMALLGWVTVSAVGDRPSVTVQTDVIRDDARSAAEATERAVKKAAAEGEELVEEARRTEVDVDVRREPADR